RIFMGDGGSLVLGFALAYLTVRTTYIGESPTGEPLAGGWYGVLMPLVVLAVPLYDMVSVTLIRLRQGRSPMVGDLQHLSHRLVKRGFGKTTAVLVIWGLTGATALAGVALPRLEAWQATLAGVQTLLLLGVIALLEYSSSPAGARPDSLSLHPR
ncbi:MAG: undecaprenyl/decaprenyl-phosphate alpha-N-acetylglucosaminyl 1-phosphate transferase, partial [Planctomycetota bacterium]